MRAFVACAFLLCLWVSVGSAQRLQLDVGAGFAGGDDSGDEHERGYSEDGEGPESFGGLLRIDLAYVPTSWFSMRPYVGALLTPPDSRTCGDDVPPGLRPCFLSAMAGIAGAKLRLTAPIPYVAVFVEAGIGGSFGVVETHLPHFDKRSLVAMHVPYGLGLALGREHRFGLEIMLLPHPLERNFTGSFTASYAVDIPTHSRPERGATNHP